MSLLQQRIGVVLFAVVCPLFCGPAVLGADGAAGANAVQVVALTSAEPAGFREPGAIGSLLLRELARQAVLIAARDELGAATRDETLRETFPDGAIVVDITTAANGRPGGALTVKLQTGDPPRAIGEVSLPLRKVPGRAFDCTQVIEQAEAWSRNELVAALKQAGVKDQRPKPAPNDIKNMAQAQALLATSTDLLAMVNAARLAHSAAALDPANPRSASALIRAYALLGVESEFLWCAADRVFHARALLYAERWAKRDPKSVDAIEHRAFARALAGLHVDALADLAAAKTLVPPAQPGPQELRSGQLKPSWVAMIEPLCKYQTGKLVAAMKEAGEDDPLPSLLCFRSVRYADSQAAVIGYGRAALQLNPGAVSIVDRAAELSGVSGGHVFTEAAPMMTAGLTHERLLAAKDLPPKIRGLFGQTPERLLDPENVAPDYGLIHAQVNSQIAYRYMARKDFAAAEPFADEAGSSFAAWALSCQIECKEGLGKFDEAEKLVVAKAQRYGGLDDWLIWCMRTGKGNLAAATKAAEVHDRSQAGNTDRESIVGRLTYRWSIGKRLEGAKLVQEHVAASGDGYSGLLAAVAFDEAKDAASRDQMLDAVATRGHLLIVNNRARLELVAIAKAWQAAIADPKSPLTTDQLIALADIAPAGERQNALYVGAAILARQGNTKAANRLRAMCVLASRKNQMMPTTIAYSLIELRSAGIDPTDTKKLTDIAGGG